ncbi:AraC family transcriptional regulator [Bauldia sp.]|uniref:AraC family transcriptional regulator n=1 Tax=Bauldia sp. TaxID=2575872 RepID=UPI003BA8DEA4
MDRSQSADAPADHAAGPAMGRWTSVEADAAIGGHSSEALPDFELIVRQPRQSFHWKVHDFPYPFAKWHYHPEYELHLIQKTSGKMFVGDYIGNFEPGNLVLTGPNLPHNWVSDNVAGEVVRHRDMLIQFSDDIVRDMMRVCLELEEIEPLLDDARYGIQFFGETARFGARALRRIGEASPTRRMLLFLELLDELNRSRDRKILSSRNYAPTLDHAVSDTINRAIDFLIGKLGEEIRLSDVARHCAMSDAAFSRFFKKNTGHGFVRYVNRMRVNRACLLLTQTTGPITDICFETGFNNLSNFNRQFLAICGMTPSEYRRQAKRNLKKSASESRVVSILGEQGEGRSVAASS